LPAIVMNQIEPMFMLNRRKLDFDLHQPFTVDPISFVPRNFYSRYATGKMIRVYVVDLPSRVIEPYIFSFCVRHWTIDRRNSV
jgi:hypothetical protein